MKQNDYIGIDYGNGLTNIDTETSIRYGCISLHSLASWIYDDCESIYPDTIEVICKACGTVYQADNDPICPNENCETQDWSAWDHVEPIGQSFLPNDPNYTVEYSESMNCLIITRSPYYTFTMLCSPCIPGAGDLDNPVENGVKTYCFNSDMFEDNKPPYTVYSVATGEQVK